MNKDSPVKALIVVLVVALVCSALVSITVVSLKPVNYRNQLIERSRNILGLTGLTEPGQALTDAELTDAVANLDMRVLDIGAALFVTDVDAATYDARAARNDPELSVEISAQDDLAGIGRRERYAIVYVVWQDDQLQRLILPVYGQGMWSTMYGFIALESDLNTIAAMSFYEQAETAGIGDQVESSEWLQKWRGRRIYAPTGEVRFRIAGGIVDPRTPAAEYEVDVMTGATITGDRVTRIVRYWFGPAGYGPFINKLREQPPRR